MRRRASHRPLRSFDRWSGGQVYHNVPLLLDTGADVSILPLHVASAVGVIPLPSHVPILFLNTESASLMQAELQLEFLHYRFRGRFLLTESAYGVVGRNILNLLTLTLHGPRQTWSA